MKCADDTNISKEEDQDDMQEELDDFKNRN